MWDISENVNLKRYLRARVISGTSEMTASSNFLISLQSLKKKHCLKVQHHSFPLQFTSNDFIFLLMPPFANPGPERHSAFQRDTDCFACLFTTHRSADLS